MRPEVRYRSMLVCSTSQHTCKRRLWRFEQVPGFAHTRPSHPPILRSSQTPYLGLASTTNKAKDRKPRVSVSNRREYHQNIAKAMAATTETVQERPQATIAATASEPTTNVTSQSQDNYSIHDAKTLREAGELKLKDEKGKELPFKSLYEGQSGRQLIIFIRHFFCGVRCKPAPPLPIDPLN